MQSFRPPVTDRKVCFALAGCGRIAASHFEAMRRHAERAELVAVCDTDPQALEAAARTTGSAGFRTLAEMLASAQADCVVLCTPSGLHPQQAMQAARAGLDIVTEKPMATRWSDGLEMVRACDAAGARLFVVKQNRRNATLQLLRRAIDAGRFGRIYMVGVNVCWTRPQAYYDSATWRGTWEFDGGAFMNQASHYVDLLDWLIGPVESVMACTGTLARRIEVEDTGVAALKWRNGAMGTISVTMLTWPKNLEGSITILGEKGSVRVGVQNTVSVYDAVTLEDDVFCGPSMVFTNVYNPRAAVERKAEYRRTLVERGATLGANCTIVCGVTIGEYAFVGAGAVVQRDVPDFALVVGVPARRIGWMSRHGERLALPVRGEGEAGCPATGSGTCWRGRRCGAPSNADPSRAQVCGCCKCPGRGAGVSWRAKRAWTKDVQATTQRDCKLEGGGSVLRA